MPSAAEEHTAIQAAPYDVGHSAAVNGSAAVLYMTGVTAQMKEDVMYSTLWAQIQSDRMFPGRPMDKRKEWHDNYQAVLLGLGWTVKSFSETELGNASAYGSVDRLVIELEVEDLDDQEFVLFQDMISSLRKPANSDPLRVFDQMAVHSLDAGFQVGVVSNSESNALFKCGAHQYNSKSDTVSSALFYTFTPTAIVPYFAVNQIMELDTDKYAGLRDIVRAHISDVVQDLIREIEL
ncbi:hypothetical protein GY45DRAFT_1368888 [Cubamyces sp. BRFM 1775]|nr:hypothetical protein GY45DRAFT_1368888 [Cubamyces sp. BRFM 1775]